jgi:membrane associated rhomboid family serine protease
MAMALEQQGDARALVGQGDALLADGQVREAAAAYAQAVQVDPSAVGGHLGLAEANLALGATGIVYMACRQVQMLAPDGADAALARAILFVVERRYDAAVKELDRVAELDPGRAYAHALRGYCLRRIGRNGDGALAEAKSARLSGNRELAQLFPQVETPAAPVYGAAAPSPFSATPPQPASPPEPVGPRPWSERSQFERQMTRVRFATANNAIVTKALIAINVAVYFVGAVIAGNLLEPAQNSSPLYQFGVQQGSLIAADPVQAYRLVTAMFLHIAWWHIGVNMLSLWFVGVLTERMFGSGKYLLIYFVSGIAGGVLSAVLMPDVPSLGASGAIFGIFGAFGAYILMRRRQLGPAGNYLIGQWLFYLVLNLVISFSFSGIDAWDHMGGLAAGFILGAILVASAGKNRSTRRYIA